MLFVRQVSELDSRQDGIELSGVTLGTLTAALQLVLLGLAASSYRQMGWRTYSKCAADMRVKDADKLRQLYVQVNIFTTHIKLDFMVGSVLLPCSRSP